MFVLATCAHGFAESYGKLVFNFSKKLPNFSQVTAPPPAAGPPTSTALALAFRS